MLNCPLRGLIKFTFPLTMKWHYLIILFQLNTSWFLQRASFCVLHSHLYFLYELPIRILGLIHCFSLLVCENSLAVFYWAKGYVNLKFWCVRCSVMPDSCDPIDCSPPGSTVHDTLQARILEWVAISCSRRFFQPKNRTLVSCIASGLFTNWALREAQNFGGSC